MKLITAVIFIVFFLSCKSGVKESDVGTYLFLRDSAVASTQKTDTTLLNFRFGMKKEEVNNRLKELEADSSVFYDLNESCYTYVFRNSGTETENQIYCKIAPRYYKGELYMVHFSSYKKGNSLIDSELVSSRMYSFLEEKYGPCNVSFRPDKNVSPFNVWFINNEEFMIWKTANGATLQCADLVRELKREQGGPEGMMEELKSKDSELESERTLGQH